MKNDETGKKIPIIAPTESTAELKPSPEDEDAAARLVFRDQARERDVILLVTREDVEQIHLDSLSLLPEIR